MINNTEKEHELVLQNIYATYTAGNEMLTAVEDVTLNVFPGEFVSVLGPSGCGKTTLLKIASGLVNPVRGHVILGGEIITGQPQRVGYMPQQDLLLPWKTLIQNAALPLIANGLDKISAEKQATKMLPVFGLEGFEHYYPAQLSGGMRQRCALLRTMLIESNLMLLDEPFASLDALTREKLQHWLIDVLYRFKKSTLFVTHSIDKAIFLSDRIYVMSERPGRIVLKEKIDLPKPRDRSIITSPHFSLYKQLLTSTLNES